jgi:hypothetical protein
MLWSVDGRRVSSDRHSFYSATTSESMATVWRREQDATASPRICDYFDSSPLDLIVATCIISKGQSLAGYFHVSVFPTNWTVRQTPWSQKAGMGGVSWTFGSLILTSLILTSLTPSLDFCDAWRSYSLLVIRFSCRCGLRPRSGFSTPT